MAHGDLETEQNLVRKLVIKVLSGDRPLKMEVTGLPVHEQALAAQLNLSQKLTEALDGKGCLSVSVRDEKENNPDVLAKPT